MAGSVWPALVAGARAKASEVEAKFDWIEADIVPMIGGTRTDATYDLGTSSHRFRDIYISRNLIGGQGTAAAPTYVFTGQTTDGMWSAAAGQVAFSCAGVEKFRIRATGAIITSASTDDAYLQITNASQSYSLGIDTSDSNALVAAVGTALGTNNFMRTVTTGESNFPLQPCVLAYLSSVISNVTGDGTLYTIIFDTEVFDQNSDYNNATGTFTAPVTGKYLVTYHISLAQVSTAGCTSNQSKISTSGGLLYTYNGVTAQALITNINSVIIPLTAGETFTIITSPAGGTKTVDINGSSTRETFLSVFLVA